MADTVFDEYLTQLARKETAQTAAGTVLSKDDPDATAESLRVGAELGVPASVVAARPDAFKDDLAQKKATQALEGAPKVSAWLRDPVNGALAKDDLDNLSWFEKRQSVKGFKTGVTGMKQMGAAAATIPVGAIKSTGMKRLELFKQAEGLDPNLEPFEIAEALGIDPMTPSASMVADYVKGDVARRQRHINRSIGMVDSSDETLQSLIGAVKQYSKEMEKTQGRVPNFTDISDVKDFGDWFAYNSGQSIPFLATVLASGLVAGPTGAVAAGYGMGVGDIQAGLIEEGVEDRGGLALAGGLPYAALERLGPAGAPFRRIGKEVIEEVAKGYFKRLGRELPKQMVEEFINEAGQEIIKDIAVGEGTGEGVTLDNEQLLAWFNSGMAGAAGAVTFTPASTAVEMRMERRIKEAENAGSAKPVLEEVDEMAANSKLKARSPDKFAEVLAQADVSEVYIPADGLRELFQAKDVPLDDETLAAWGINPSDFEQQSQVAGMVAVPTSAYSAKISGTDDAQWFKDNATLDPMELTSTEAAQFNEQFQDVLADAFEQAEAEERQAQEYRSAETQVYDAMFSQLRAAGQTVDVAEKNALLFKSFIATQAQREGEDAVDVARRFGVEVRGPEQQTNRRRGQIDVMLNTLRKNTNKALKPQGRDLLQFIIDEGGLADVGGDVAALDAPKGLIGETFEQIAERASQPNLDGSAAQSVAMGLDEMARRAIEAGYFPELLGGNDINADGTVIDEAAVLLDAVTRAISGEGIYLDGEGVNPDYQALSDELSQRGIDLADMTNDEVVALLEQDGQQYNQSGELVTDTPEFKAWFGDSQVVDENGAPLVVYHGTDRDFEAFDAGAENSTGVSSSASFFTKSKNVADGYGGRVESVYLSIQDPAVADFGGRSRFYFDGADRSPSELVNRISEINDDLKNGYGLEDDLREELAQLGWEDSYGLDYMDGVVLKNVDDSMDAFGGEISTHYVAFAPTQIKSVHNRGTFDGSDPRILYQKDDGLNRVKELAAASGVDLSVSERGGYLTVNKIVSGERGTGKGSAVMQELVGYADATGQVIALTPSKDFGGSVGRLKTFYKRFGFVENKGKNRDFETQESMVRVPDGARAFFQSDSNPRGSIVLPAGGVENGQTIINLMETANMSTFLHEFGHYTLEVFNVLASDPDASEGMKADLAAIHKFLDGDITKTESHEKWARAFEQYLMEGKAPSLELATAFARFKSWLTRIYKTARGLNVKLTPEIREVMDRLIATDEQIAEARDAAEMAPLFKSAPAGMSKQTYETYRKTAQRAAEQGEERLIKRTMEKVRREKEKWYKAERAEVRKQVSTAISSRPEYRLIEVMANKVWVGKDVQVPDIQLDRAELAEAFGDGIFTELSRSKIGGKRAIYKAGGISLSEAAEFFGFESPVKMVDALQNAGKRKDAIEVETDRVMLDRYGDPLNDGTIEQEALEAVHTEQQAQSIVAEARYFADRAGASTKNMSARVYRQRARLMLGRMTVGQAMKPDTFLAAERRAARGAEEAFARIIKGKDPEAALAAASRHKEHQLLNHYLYLESRDFSKKLASKRTKMQAYNKKSVRAKLEGGYIEQIDAILEQYDFRVRSAGQVSRSESLRDFVARMEEEGRAGELAIDERLIAQAEKVHYTKLTMDELLGLFDTIDNIDHLGRYKQKLIDAKEKRDLEEIASMVGAQMDKNISGTPPGRTETGGERRRRLGRDFLNTTLNADTLLREIDGFEDIGPVWNAMKSKIDAGMNNLVERRVGVAKAFDEIYSVYSGNEKREMNKKVLIEPLGVLLNRWELISLALNTGNEANFERLTNPKAKGTFTAQQVNEALALLDERDWKVVQSLWDYIDGFWPEIAAKEKRQTGTTPKKVAALQMADAPDFVRGGYFPIKYDARLSGLTDDFQQKELADSLMGGKFGKAQTRNGHTKERTTTTQQPLMLDLGVAHNHVEQVLYDIELGEAVNGTWKILQKTKPLFFEKGKQSDFTALELWVQDVASGERIAADGFWRVMRHIRTGFTVSRLALNVSTALIQPSGLVQSAVVVGKTAVAKGTISYFRNAKRWTDEVLEVSPMMRERKKTFERDVFNVVGDLEGGPITGRWEKFQRDVILPASFWMMQTVQFHAVDMPTWVSAYEKEIGISGDEERARVYADTMVKRAQGSGLMSDRGMFERGTLGKNLRQHEATKMLTALGSYMFAKGNVAYEQAAKTDFKNPVEVMSLAVDVALLFTLEAVLYSAVKGFLPDEDEDWAAWLATETMFSAFSTLPFFRELSGATQGFGGGGIYGATVEALARPAIQIGQGEADKALVNSMTDFLGVTMHLPASQTKAVVNTFFEDDLSLKGDPNLVGALGVGAGGRSLADLLLDN